MRTPTFYDGNEVTLLAGGAEFFPALLAEIAAATVEIRIETYIFQDDEVGQEVAQALQAAVGRGVRVHLLIDGVGSRIYSTDHLPALRQAGIDTAVYRPDLAQWALVKSRLRRLHRKVSLFDGRVAFVGGINIISDFAPPNNEHPQFDYAVRVLGPVVADIRASMVQIWRVVNWSRLRRSRSAEAMPATTATVGDARVAFVYRDNLRHRRDIERLYIAGITNAKHEVLLACAYFFPGYRLRRTIVRAARRGVKVTLLLQGYSDHPLLLFATHALHWRFLKHKVRVVEYHRAMLHAKVCVIDDTWATVGSSNLDPLSLMMAREANLAIDCPTFASRLRASLNAAIAESQVIESGRWANRAWYLRATSWFAYQLARISLGILGLTRSFRD
jgi:cardiolipin synthase A/B